MDNIYELSQRLILICHTLYGGCKQGKLLDSLMGLSPSIFSKTNGKDTKKRTIILHTFIPSLTKDCFKKIDSHWNVNGRTQNILNKN